MVHLTAVADHLSEHLWDVAFHLYNALNLAPVKNADDG